MPALMAILAVALLAGCGNMQQLLMQKPAPALGFRYGELIVDDGFDSGDHWRQYENGDGLFLGARDGVYRVDFRGRRYVWAQRDGDVADVVIQADARQVSAYDHNAYGLACRLDPANSGRGYFFLISGDGYASIRWSNGRSLQPIVSAAPSAQVRQGQSSNRLRVVCIDDYLALWVNGAFVADARDRRATQGAVGLAGVMNYGGERLTVDFDDVKVWRADLDGGDS